MQYLMMKSSMLSNRTVILKEEIENEMRSLQGKAIYANVGRGRTTLSSY